MAALESPDCSAEEAGVHIARRIARVLAYGCAERGQRTVALAHGGARGAQQALRARMVRPRGHDLASRGHGILWFAAKEQGGRLVVARFGPIWKPGDHCVRERREPLAIAGVGEHGGQLLSGARFVRRQPQRLGRRCRARPRTSPVTASMRDSSIRTAALAGSRMAISRSR